MGVAHLHGAGGVDPVRVFVSREGVGMEGSVKQ
jgi:hypothetical protein